MLEPLQFDQLDVSASGNDKRLCKLYTETLRSLAPSLGHISVIPNGRVTTPDGLLIRSPKGCSETVERMVERSEMMCPFSDPLSLLIPHKSSRYKHGLYYINFGPLPQVEESPADPGTSDFLDRKHPSSYSGASDGEGGERMLLQMIRSEGWRVARGMLELQLALDILRVEEFRPLEIHPDALSSADFTVDLGGERCLYAVNLLKERAIHRLEPHVSLLFSIDDFTLTMYSRDISFGPGLPIVKIALNGDTSEDLPRVEDHLLHAAAIIAYATEFPSRRTSAFLDQISGKGYVFTFPVASYAEAEMLASETLSLLRSFSSAWVEIAVENDDEAIALRMYLASEKPSLITLAIPWAVVVVGGDEPTFASTDARDKARELEWAISKARSIAERICVFQGVDVIAMEDVGKHSLSEIACAIDCPVSGDVAPGAFCILRETVESLPLPLINPLTHLSFTPDQIKCQELGIWGPRGISTSLRGTLRGVVGSKAEVLGVEVPQAKISFSEVAEGYATCYANELPLFDVYTTSVEPEFIDECQKLWNSGHFLNSWGKCRDRKRSRFPELEAFDLKKLNWSVTEYETVKSYVYGMNNN